MALINTKQYDALSGFYTHCYCVYHDKVKSAFGFWAEQLDALDIPWSVQNTVSELASDRESMGYYLSTLLKKKGIIRQ